jgi:hypothetical protein
MKVRVAQLLTAAETLGAYNDKMTGKVTGFTAEVDGNIATFGDELEKWGETRAELLVREVPDILVKHYGRHNVLLSDGKDVKLAYEGWLVKVREVEVEPDDARWIAVHAALRPVVAAEKKRLALVDAVESGDFETGRKIIEDMDRQELGMALAVQGMPDEIIAKMIRDIKGE